MGEIQFILSEIRRNDEEIVRDERTPEQVVLDYLNDYHQKASDNWAKRLEFIPKEFKAIHSKMLGTYSEPFRIIGNALQTGSNKWLVGAVAGLDGAKLPDIPVQFALVEFEHFPGKMATPSFLKTSPLHNADVVTDGAGEFDNYSYQEINEELEKSGFVAVVRVLNSGLVAVLGLVRSDVKNIRIVMPNSAPIILTPTKQSFLAILCANSACNHFRLRYYDKPFTHTKDYKHYFPLSVSAFDASGKRIGHNYWPSQKQLDKFNWYL